MQHGCVPIASDATLHYVVCHGCNALVLARCCPRSHHIIVHAWCPMAGLHGVWRQPVLRPSPLVFVMCVYEVAANRSGFLVAVAHRAVAGSVHGFPQSTTRTFANTSKPAHRHTHTQAHTRKQMHRKPITHTSGNIVAVVYHLHTFWSRATT